MPDEKQYAVVIFNNREHPIAVIGHYDTEAEALAQVPSTRALVASRRWPMTVRVVRRP